MTVQLPYTLTNGTTPDANQVMANLLTLRDKTHRVRNADIIDAAGIDKSKLSQKLKVDTVLVNLVPYSSDASWESAAAFTIPAALTVMQRFRRKLASGQREFLASIEWCPEDVTVGGADYPSVDVQVDGVTMGGQAITLNTDTAYYTIANSNPLSNPLYPIINNSVVTCRLGATGAGGPTIRACTLALTFVSEAV